MDDDAPSADAVGMLYDWFKHLTSLALIALGGVLGLAQGRGGETLKPAVLIAVLAMLGLSALLAFSGTAQLVQARVRGTGLPKHIHATQGAAAMLLSMGVGGFTYTFVQILG